MSVVFWSQAVIAEVYTLNTFFFILLLLLGLRGAPLPWMALLFGLSLSNHWPLMILPAALRYQAEVAAAQAELTRELSQPAATKSQDSSQSDKAHGGSH